MDVGKTRFAQVMEFVPWTSFTRIVPRDRGHAGVRTLSCAEQFRAMAVAQLTGRERLRDIEVSLSANPSKLYAMGVRSPINRSTLADANESRDGRIWFDLATVLIRRARTRYARDSLGVELTNTVYALDSSPVDLCLSLFDWAPFRSTNAALKLHPLLDLRGCIPACIYMSDGTLHDVKVLDLLAFEVGAFSVMARGYVDFARRYVRHQAGAFFVTRATSTFNARRVYSAPCERDRGVICDQRVALNGFSATRDYPKHLRRIRFKDPDSDNRLVFLTPTTALSALTICALSKPRWQVDRFFTWIQQPLRIKKFLGTSENAVKTQVWSAIATSVLIAIVKKELQLEASRYTCLQILSVSVFEKTPLSCALQLDDPPTEPPAGANQLIVFNL